MKLRHLFLFLLLCTTTINAQNRILSVTEMHEDIDYYLSTLRLIHPNLYARYDASQFDALAQELKEKTSKPLPINQFRWMMARFNRLTDTHTEICVRHHNDPPFPWITSKNGKTFLGDYILVNVGGVDANRIYEEVAALVSWETHPANKSRIINMLFFPYIYDFYQQVAPFNCRLRCARTSAYRNSIVSIISRADWITNAVPSFNPSNHSNQVSFRMYEEESIAVLFYNSSMIDKSYSFVVNVINDFFDDVKEKEIQTIFIDVSKNGGGSDLMHNHIFRHLRSQPFNFKTIQYATTDGMERFYAFMRDYFLPSANLCTTNEEFVAAFERIKKLKQERRVEMVNSLAPEEAQGDFNGNVFVIMGSLTGSAADSFCLSIKMGQMGMLVGEPSGQYNPFSGNSPPFILPNSEIPFRVATTHTVIDFPAHINIKDGFLQPCIPFPLTRPLGLEDYIQIIELAREKGKIER